MKKKLLRITTIIVIATVAVINFHSQHSLFSPSTVEAIGDLTVDFGVPPGDPIFTLTNLAPGDMHERTVTVTNDATVPRPVGIRGIKTSDSGNLSDVFDIVISENGTEIYTETLAQFFEDSSGPDGIFLSDLQPANTTTYTVKAIFQETAGNQYQNQQLIFDLKIGIVLDLPDECDAIDLSDDPIFGTERSDRLVGTAGNDLIMGFEGNDIIRGGGGDDCIIAGVGNDIAFAGAGNDAIFMNEGNDVVRGESGDDFIDGGDGHDALFGENGDDIIDGRAGHDVLIGGQGNDILTGHEGHDVAMGSQGTDTCEAEVKQSCEL